MWTYHWADKHPRHARPAGFGWRTYRLQLLTAAVTMSSLACGGRVAPDPDTETSTETGKQGGDSGSPASTNQGNMPSATGDDWDSDSGLPLGECPEGWAPGSADCPWLASDDLCYATKADACACICPRRNDTTCISGLPGGSDSRTWVSCD